MSALLPQINEWDRLGLDWTYLDEAKYAPITIPAKGQIQLPRGDYIFRYPEGVIIQFSALFDHPLCGWRLEAHPGLDTGDVFTIGNVAIGLTRPEVLSYVSIPPVTPPGVFLIRICGPWVFKEWLRIYVINTDVVSHRLLGHSYHMAVLKEERPKET